jgi:uncharacterized protein
MEDHSLPQAHASAPELAPPPAAPQRRFCPRCGTPWDPQWTDCPYCQRRAASAVMTAELAQEKDSIKAAIWLYGLLLAVSIVSICVALAIQEELGFVGDVVATICFAVIVLAFFLGCRRVVTGAFTTLGPKRWLIAAPLLAVGTFALATAAVKAMHLFLGMKELQYLPDFQHAGFGLGMATLLVAVAPAVSEETAFRGIIFGLLSRVLSRWETIFVTAGMFAILHLSIMSLPHLFILGVVLAWLRARTGSIYSGMILHFTHNLCCLLMEQAGGKIW